MINIATILMKFRMSEVLREMSVAERGPDKSSTSQGRLVQWKNVRFIIDFSRGPRFDPRRRTTFQSRFLSQKGLTEIQYVDGFFQSRNLDRSAVATSTLYERERSPQIGPMTSYLCVGVTSYILYLRDSTTIPQPVSITSSQT